ncbi:MAG TPA: thiamine pyrophosphate-dependent dehydrogenase E1 component subunit alpha [Gemmatimonadaceae bacterium]|nr:thiamine pyrophosphate-dependent dehydrogenase E1 component subunit alpha [Gemmatimonadaceae bacterium]
MKRYPAFDPPEYVAWTRDDHEVEAFRERLRAEPARAAVLERLTNDQRLDLYRGLVRTRLTDIALKRWVRQGVISKAWLGTGEEATTVGPVHALRRMRKAESGMPDHDSEFRISHSDIVAPMIRNSGACSEMGMPVAEIFRAYMGTADGPTRGRDGHYGSIEHGVIAPISHVGDMVPIVTGIALSFAARGTGQVAMTWIGDGSTKTGVAHEGLNFAAVRRAPAIFIIQNNQVALGTRLAQHHLAATSSRFADWPRAYGMWGGVFDGNNVLDAYALTALAVERCRRGDGPAMLVSETFRMGGHATHDEAEARETFDAKLFAQWGRRDPIGLYEEYLADDGVPRSTLADIEAKVEAEVERAQEEALASRRDHMPEGKSAVEGVYA